MIKSFKQYISEVKSEGVVFTFGRFNPPHIGHETLCDAVAKIAGRDKYFIFVSQSHDTKKNPLDYATKVKWMRKMFPKHARSIIMDTSVKTVFDAATFLYAKGYRKVKMIVGSDRKAEFDKLMHKYNDVKGAHGYYNFESLDIVSGNERDPDTGISATKLRKAVKNNDFNLFLEGLPPGFKDAQKLYNDLRIGMGLSESKAFRRDIKLKPVSMDRETYVKGNLHHIGDVVEISEGIGEIEILGANYVIVKTAMGNKYRKWITDIKSVVHNTSSSEDTTFISKNTPRAIRSSITETNMTSSFSP